MPGATKPPRELTRKIPEDAADMSVEQEILATSIKVINLLAPNYKGDKMKVAEMITQMIARAREEATKLREEAPSPREEPSGRREEHPREESLNPRKELPNPREEMPGPREAMKQPRPTTQPPPPWCATREPPRELPGAADPPRELTGEIPTSALGYDTFDFDALEHDALINNMKCNGSYTVPRLLESSSKKLVQMEHSILATDITTVKTQDQDETATFMFESPNQEKTSDYEMKLTTLDQEDLGIPETVYSAVIQMPSGEPQRVVRDLSQLGKPTVILCTKEEEIIITEMQEPPTITTGPNIEIWPGDTPQIRPANHVKLPIRSASPTRPGDAIGNRKLCDYEKENFEKTTNDV